MPVAVMPRLDDDGPILQDGDQRAAVFTAQLLPCHCITLHLLLSRHSQYYSKLKQDRYADAPEK